MKLSDRLESVAAMISDSIPVVDVGTDHAYLPVSLVQRGKTPCALCSDLRRGPIDRARQNIKEAQVEDRVKAVLCDGVPPLSSLDEELRGGALVIAGMGGPLMASILEKASDRLDFFSEIIAEPQSDLSTFRKCLSSLGFAITEENMIREDGKYYPIIKAKRAKTPSDLSEMAYAFGPCLIAAKHPILKEYAEKQLCVTENLLTQMASVSGDKARQRKAELDHQKALLENLLEQLNY